MVFSFDNDSAKGERDCGSRDFRGLLVMTTEILIARNAEIERGALWK